MKCPKCSDGVIVFVEPKEYSIVEVVGNKVLVDPDTGSSGSYYLRCCSCGHVLSDNLEQLNNENGCIVLIMHKENNETI